MPFPLAASSDGSKLYIGVEGGLLVREQQLLNLQPGSSADTQEDRGYSEGRPVLQSARYNRKTLLSGVRKDNQVVVVDTKTDTVLKTIPVQGGPMDVVFPPGDEVWVDAVDGSISIIDSSKARREAGHPNRRQRRRAHCGWYRTFATSLRLTRTVVM